MKAYPGYTVETIRNGLSWREVELLLRCWHESPGASRTLEKIEMILTKAHGIKWLNTKPNESDGDVRNLIDRLDMWSG